MRRFLTRDGRDCRLFPSLLPAVHLIEAGLRLGGFRRIRGWMGLASIAPAPTPESIAREFARNKQSACLFRRNFPYRAYGLQIASDHPIPAFLPASGEETPDVRLHWLDTYSPLPGGGLEWRDEQAGRGEQRGMIHLWRGPVAAGEYVWLRLMLSRRRPEWHVDLVISPAATEMWVRPSGGVEHIDLMSTVINVGLGALLRLRGVVCLHGSTIVLGGRGVVIVGPKQAGKSTLAGAMMRCGAGLLADDIAALRPAGGTTLVEPGIPSLRLWPASLEALAEDYGALTKVSTIRTKRHLPVSVPRHFEQAPRNPFIKEAVPISAIYVLANREEREAAPAIEFLSHRDCLPALVANTFAGYMLTSELRKQEFILLSELIQRTPIRRVRRPDDLGRLSELCQLMLADNAAIAA